MTTEDDFQRQLDANPDDHHTRLVFADWLQERDDPRATGYRALGVLGRNADRPNLKCPYWYKSEFGSGSHALPNAWYALLDMPGKGSANCPQWGKGMATRRECENAAALAFARLSAERRAELLAARAPT